MKRGVCVKCGSGRVLGNLRIIDRSYMRVDDLEAEVEKYPDALFLKGKVHAPIRAWICRDCGYTELYTDKADRLAVGRPEG